MDMDISLIPVEEFLKIGKDISESSKLDISSMTRVYS
jgi:hypothetical protein